MARHKLTDNLMKYKLTINHEIQIPFSPAPVFFYRTIYSRKISLACKTNPETKPAQYYNYYGR